jgi:hypothetical protein
LHLATRDSTVRAQLLFANGDAYVEQRVAETERILRTRGYLSDAWVVPIAYDEASNVVDISVTVRDVWTLNPGVSFGRAGGSSHTKFQLDDSNLLGRGSRISISRSSDVDRTSTVLSYQDPMLFRSWWQLSTSYASNSDGRVSSLSLVRPFYALDTHRAFGASGLDGTSRVERWSRGQVLDQFLETHRAGQLFYGWSDGLANGVTSRWLAGVRYDAATFVPEPGFPALYPLPADRKFAYPWIGWQRVEDRWEKGENVDLIGRTEDLDLGRSLYVEVGATGRTTGLHGAALLLRVDAADAWQIDERQQLYTNATLDGRLDAGVAENVRLTAGVRYFVNVTASQTSYAALAATVSRRLDGDQQVLLGGDTGLRAYPLRFQGGTSSALVTLEHRVFTPWYPFRLVRVGGAVFFDAGRTWGRDYTGAQPLGMLKDVGIGLRLGNVRSGLGNMLHIDLSYAFDAPPGIKRTQVTVETKSRF